MVSSPLIFQYGFMVVQGPVAHESASGVDNSLPGMCLVV